MDEGTGRLRRPPVGWTLWLGAALVLLLVLLAYVAFGLQRGLRKPPPLPVLSRVTAFTLTNQFGQAVSQTNLAGHVWVADVIFTRCQSSCLAMTRRMAGLQAALPSNPRLRLVSLTADPEFDSPVVLQAYATNHGADTNRWIFLTGPKKELYRFAIEDLKFAVVDQTAKEREPLEEMFLHSTLFAVIDAEGRVRGYFDGTSPEAVAQIPAVVKRLLQEKAP